MIIEATPFSSLSSPQKFSAASKLRRSYQRYRFFFLATAWALLVIAFSLIYWCAWQSQSDSFIVNREFNLNPIEELRSRLSISQAQALSGPTTQSAIVKSIGLDEMMMAIDEVDSIAKDLNEVIASLKLKQQALELDRERVGSLHSASMSKNMENYRARELAAVKAEVRRNADIVEGMQKAYGDTPPSHQGIMLAEARVELADARLREATKAAEVGSYVLENIGTFADAGTSDALEKIDENLQKIALERNRLALDLGALQEKANQIAASWRKNRTDRLSWIDFIYFSVGVSSSTTFGDIIPNNRFVRIMALIQLLASIFMLGYLVSLASPALAKQEPA